jgi:hypothetical protein
MTNYSRAFSKPLERVDVVTIDEKSLGEIRDIAHRIYSDTRSPNANLVMYQALADYMGRRGASRFVVKLAQR